MDLDNPNEAADENAADLLPALTQEDLDAMDRLPRIDLRKPSSV